MKHDLSAHSDYRFPQCRLNRTRRPVTGRLPALLLALALAAIALSACGSGGTTSAAPTTGSTTTAAATAVTTAASSPATTASAVSAVSSAAGSSAATQATTAATAAPTTATAAPTGAAPLTGPITAADLVLTVDGQPFALLSDAAPLLQKLGKQFQMTQADSCVYEGFDKTFDYGFLQVFTIPKGKTDLLDGIYLNDARYRTARGIKVGDTLAAVKAAYGASKASGDLVYNLSGNPDNLSEPSLTFIIEKDAVAAISYYSGSNSQGAAR